MASPPAAPTHVIRCRATLTPPSNSRTWQTAPHPSSPIVATACSDRSVRVYSLTSFTLLHSITGGHKRSVRSVSWKPHVRGQDVLATGSFDASAGIWRKRHDQGLEREINGQGDEEEDEEDEDEEDESEAEKLSETEKQRKLTPEELQEYLEKEAKVMELAEKQDEKEGEEGEKANAGEEEEDKGDEEEGDEEDEDLDEEDEEADR